MRPLHHKILILAYWWAPPFLIAAIQFGLSSWSSPPQVPFRFPGWDKVMHGLIYFVMAVATLRAIRGYHQFTFKKSFKIAMLLCIVYGMTDEIHQVFVPGRAPEWQDWIADAVGSLLGGCAWFVWEKIAPWPHHIFRNHPRFAPPTNQPSPPEHSTLESNDFQST